MWSCDTCGRPNKSNPLICETCGAAAPGADPDQVSMALQRDLPGRIRWDGSSAPLIRPGPRVAYVETRREEQWSVLAEHVVEALCNPS